MPNPSEMQRIMDALADGPGRFDQNGPIKAGAVFPPEHPAEAAARDYRDAAKWKFDEMRKELLSLRAQIAGQPTPGGHVCQSPATTGDIIDPGTRDLIDRNRARLDEINTLRGVVESQARTIVGLNAELVLMREQRLMDERRWVDDMAGRGNSDQRPELCPKCGYPRHEDHPTQAAPRGASTP